MITHVVAFKYKSSAPVERCKELACKILALGDRSGPIRSIVGGHEAGPEKLGRGFHHVFVLKFNGWEDLRYYLDFDPPHQDLQQLVSELTEDIQVWDFEDLTF